MKSYTRGKIMPTPKAPKVLLHPGTDECHPHVRYRHPEAVTADHKRWAKVKAKRKRAHASRRINRLVNK